MRIVKCLFTFFVLLMLCELTIELQELPLCETIRLDKSLNKIKMYLTKAWWDSLICLNIFAEILLKVFSFDWIFFLCKQLEQKSHEDFNILQQVNCELTVQERWTNSFMIYYVQVISYLTITKPDSRSGIPFYINSAILEAVYLLKYDGEIKLCRFAVFMPQYNVSPQTWSLSYGYDFALFLN